MIIATTDPGKSPVYDLTAPGAVQEIKAAMHALGQRAATPAFGDPAHEALWTMLGTDDVWDDAAQDEWVLFVSRWAPRVTSCRPPPYTQLATGVPQPTFLGLVLLDNAVRFSSSTAGIGPDMLAKLCFISSPWGGTTRLTQFETTVGGAAFAPKSAPNGAVRPTALVSTVPRVVVPPPTAPDTNLFGALLFALPAALLGANFDPVLRAHENLEAAWSNAQDAATEAERSTAAATIEQRRIELHEAVVAAMQAGATAPVEHPTPSPPMPSGITAGSTGGGGGGGGGVAVALVLVALAAGVAALAGGSARAAA